MMWPFPSLLCSALTLYCREHHRLEPLTWIGPSTPDVAGHCPEPLSLIGSGTPDRPPTADFALLLHFTNFAQPTQRDRPYFNCLTTRSRHFPVIQSEPLP